MSTTDALIREAEGYRGWSEALYPALLDDPFYVHLERCSEGDGRAAMLRYYDYSALEAARYGRLVASEPDPYGAALWALPVDDETAKAKARDKAAVLEATMGPAALAAYKDVGAAMEAETAAVTSDSDWYLSILGVRPEAQNGGRGRALVAPVLDEADRAGVATFLETVTPRNIPFYERLGFAVAGRFDLGPLGVPYWVMRRPTP